MEAQYFANLRTINKMEMALKEWDIQLLELKKSKHMDDELKFLFEEEKRIKRKIDEYHLKRMRDATAKMSLDGVEPKGCEAKAETHT